MQHHGPAGSALSFWHEDAADAGIDWAPKEVLDRDLQVDVAIVGGGYTGLWTAYYLATADPSLRIAALESEFVGFGASGRNGGWCSAIFPTSLRKIASTSSRDAAVRMQRAMNDTVAEIEAVVAAEGLAARGMEPAALTRREAEVLQRLAEGRTNRECSRSWTAPLGPPRSDRPCNGG